MKENKNSNIYNGIGFFGLLQVVFIALKVTKIINWSWWLVFLPMWIDLGLCLIVIIITVIFVTWVNKND